MDMDKKEFETRAKSLRPRLLDMACRCLGNKDDADDVVQDTLLKLWSMKEQLDKYQSVDAFAIVVCRHLCLDKMKRTPMSNIDDVEITDVCMSPHDIIEDQEVSTEVHSLISKLPDGQQVILKLKHIDGMETSEIAQLVGTTEVAVRVQLSRARNRIKELFLNKRI